MEDELYQYFSEGKPGLLIGAAPTGYGKTRATVRAMYRYVRSGGARHILFTTEMIKNLPEPELKQAYKDDGKAELYNKEVLKLSSPVDTIGDAIFKTKIPEDFHTKAYEDLRRKYEELERLKAFKDCGDLVKHCQDELRPLERIFRKELEHKLKREVPGSPEKRREAIRTNPRYQWMALFYPAVFWAEKKIILLTVKKLLTYNITLVEPGFPILSDRMIRDSILCIDEFDASREVILDHLIEKALSIKADYLRLFRQVYQSTAQHEISANLEAARTQYEKGRHITWAELAQEAEEIYQDGSLYYSIKSQGQLQGRHRNFLFHDTSYHSVLDGNKTHIRAVKNTAARQIELHFETREEHEAHLHESGISLHGLLRHINGFLLKFQRYIYGWAGVYAKQINSTRSGMEDLFTLDNAIETLFDEFDLSGEHIRLMSGELGLESGRGHDIFAPNLSFYNMGFSLFEFIDDERHLSQTRLQYFQLQNTPEKLLLHLCRRAAVVGLSATADLPTVTGNFDLHYLRQKLKANYHELSAETQANIVRELEAHWAAYLDDRIHVQLTVVDQDTEGLPIFELLTSVFEDEDLAEHFQQDVGDDKYNVRRYCGIFTAMKAFWSHKDIQSFLCLNQVLPEPRKNGFDLDLFTHVFDLLGRQTGEDVTDVLTVLKSGPDFEDRKKQLLQELSQGKRRFILSSYQTLGAGQNLQYPVHDRTGLVCLDEHADPGDSRLFHKDMDALYLGDVTHVVTQLKSVPPSSDAEVMKYCFQVECLHENNEISPDTLNRLLRDGISLRGIDHKARERLYHSPSVHRQITRDVIQAVGRMNRTFLKHPTVYLFTTKKLLCDLDSDCLRNRPLTPEMQALARARDAITDHRALPDTERNEAERRSNRGNRYIRQMLAYPWTETKMELWKALRQTVLCHPTAAQADWDADPIIRTYYLSLPTGAEGYCFAQTNDFSDIQISLNTDRTAFRCQLSEAYSPSVVSEADSRLPVLLQYPGMREHFEAHGWATGFADAPHILSPVLFQNIYKGALGEVAGRFILQQELGLNLDEITDPADFEVFDYKLGDDIYLDFKHWKSSTIMDESPMRRKMLDKLERINGRMVLVLNLFYEQSGKGGPTSDQRLIEVPGLLLPDGQVNRDAMELLRRVLS